MSRYHMFHVEQAYGGLCFTWNIQREGGIFFRLRRAVKNNSSALPGGGVKGVFSPSGGGLKALFLGGYLSGKYFFLPCRRLLKSPFFAPAGGC